MANAPSKVQDAQQKMTSVSEQSTEAQDSVQQWIAHLEAEKERLLAMLDGSHQDDVAALIALIDTMLERLRKADAALGEMAETAAQIETTL